MSQAVHLKFFNGACVALMEHRDPIEQLPTRYDQFQRDGGLYWARKVPAQWLWQLLLPAGARAMSSVKQEITWPSGGKTGTQPGFET